MNKKKNISIPLALMLLCVTWVSTSGIAVKNDCGEKSTPPRAAPGETVRKTVLYSYTLQNKTPFSQKEVIFATYAPVLKTSYQECIKVRASDDFELSRDDVGNQILKFRIGNLPPYATKIITINVTVNFHQHPSLVFDHTDSQFLVSEPFVESNKPEIVSLARKLKGKTSFDTASKIYTWISENIKYAGYTRFERGALYCLKHKRGDCTEFADLFVALARANKIPARRMAGYICKEGPWIRAAGYHNWAEFYDQNKWHIADSTRKVFEEVKAGFYLATRFISPTDRSVCKFERFNINNKEIKVKMN